MAPLKVKAVDRPTWLKDVRVQLSRTLRELDAFVAEGKRCFPARSRSAFGWRFGSSKRGPAVGTRLALRDRRSRDEASR